jgi:hypothetical protein
MCDDMRCDVRWDGMLTAAWCCAVPHYGVGAGLLVMDTLSKLSHDSDERVSQNAIVALGFLGAGTNNSRIANMLRQLAVYYSKEPNHLFLVRIAQGTANSLSLSPSLSPPASVFVGLGLYAWFVVRLALCVLRCAVSDRVMWAWHMVHGVGAVCRFAAFGQRFDDAEPVPL